MQEQPKGGLVLAVDDRPDSLRILTRILQEDGHQVRPVLSGEQALQLAARIRPDLVLLDISMPGMDGFEVCQALKASEETADIPVLFLSGRGGLEDRLKAFELGGVDFIGKPFKIEEVQARVRTHLAVRRLQEALESKNRELEASYVKLTELETLRTALVAMLIHDMRSPLSVIRFAVQEWAEMTEDEDDDLGELAGRSLEVLQKMMDDALDVSSLQAAEMPVERAPDDAMALVAEVVGTAQARPDIAPIVINGPEPSQAMVQVDRTLMSRVIDNLITNASRYGGVDNDVHINVGIEGDLVTIAVEDEGPGLAPEHRDRVFDQFWQATNGRRMRRGVGLGLTFCKLVVDAHGGRITAEEGSSGQGAAFVIRLPHVT